MLWYKQPTGWDWNKALPLGNGSLGAMVFDNPGSERIVLNHDTVWARSAADPTNPAALRYLPEVRRLLIEGKPAEAEFLAHATLMGSPGRLQPYQMVGELHLMFAEASPQADEDYRRSLSLREGVVRIQNESNHGPVRKTAFVSAPDGVMVYRLEATDQSLRFIAELRRPADADSRGASDATIQLVGRAGVNGTRFQVLVKAIPEGGEVSVAGGKLRVEQADAVTLLVACGTDFHGGSPEALAHSTLDAASQRPYGELLERHLEAHGELFDRVSLSLPTDEALEALPIDQRLERVQEGHTDPGLVAIYFQFGRYLLMSSSRPGGLPANLQGIWANSLTPPWNSDYHLNINLQMNYWPADVTALGECHEPLFDWMRTLAEQGARTAEVHYGARGWVAHHLSDPWGYSVPGDAAGTGLWPTGGAWLCDHIWEHFLFTRDRAFLRETFPLMLGAATFFLDYLVEDGQGQLLSGPSVSPENRYRLPSGEIGKLCMGPTMDSQIIRELFEQTIAAAEVLDIHEPAVEQLRAALPKLPPNRVGADGRLMEWAKPYDEPEPGHRHLSHLWGLHPGDQIDPTRTPELAEACRATLRARLEHGGGHTGWSAAWLINMYARLHDGETARDMLLKLLRNSTLPNLFDSHPPFQIDGNFGGTAGIAEMLLQSRYNPITNVTEIELLPALPEAWPSGSFRGLSARGGITVAAAWSASRLQHVTLQTDHPTTVILTCDGNTSERLALEAGEVRIIENVVQRTP